MKRHTYYNKTIEPVYASVMVSSISYEGVRRTSAPRLGPMRSNSRYGGGAFYRDGCSGTISGCYKPEKRISTGLVSDRGMKCSNNT
ncbi:hypothetical protein Zmor_010296 [Zophobas morio]|uniref:Uncharacterized protein n=1 Tax=Zophobas morio TaxID=2755281 RepID=A0AA38INL2_9CUCU|nr:hypothetical protein Zmor_010296 [Zophobas morio]